MNPEEYRKLAQVEQEHWFYRGKQQIVRYWIDQFIRLTRDDLLIDAGMGTGAWAVEMAGQCRVLGIDDHEESLRLAGPRLEAAGARVLKSSLERVDLPAGTAAVVTLLDVLEHLDDDRGALAEMLRLTRPGGLVVLTVPAYQWLWSDWDQVLHHRRRYSRRSLLATLAQPGAHVLRCSYFNGAMLPAIALVRWYRRWRPAASGAERLEDRVPPRLLNALLRQVMVMPACWRWWPAPFGVSLLAIIKRGQV